MTATQQQDNRPRGIRNNNPLNIREAEDGGDFWVGEHAEDLDKSFEEFQSPEYGIRAAAILLNNHRRFYGINTIKGHIEKWAPKVDKNHTENYIRFVSNRLGINPVGVIDVRDHMRQIIPAMIQFENGVQPYSQDVIDLGVSMAGF